MSHYVPLLILAVLFIALLYTSRRNRARAAARQELLIDEMGPGTEVMTTSGLYGTVVSVVDDNDVLLSVAPGIELRWAKAALKDVREVQAQRERAAARTQPRGMGFSFGRPPAPPVAADQPAGGPGLRARIAQAQADAPSAAADTPSATVRGDEQA